MSKGSRPFHEQIDGQDVQGWVAEEGRSYRAWGMFRGEEIVARGRSESHAIDLWREKANYKANE